MPRTPCPAHPAANVSQARLPGLAPAAHLPPAEHLPALRRSLLDWFAENRRPLPWRRSYSPYEVWISEIMLQQTQMERGVAYFSRWMARFPNIAALAGADEEAVLRQWEGLGYYSRARNALAAARAVRDIHGGVFPSAPEAIRALPGVGPYTAAAIASIAFNKPVACVDANVERVLARVLDIEGPVKRPPASDAIRQWAQRLLPPDNAREHNQAMMELGALVCRKKPLCGICPLASFCVSRHLGIVAQRPSPAARPSITPVEVATGVLMCAGRVFVQKRLEGDAWGGLWEFPGGCVEPGESAAQAVRREYREETGFAVRIADRYGDIRHSHTRYRLTLRCFGLRLASPPPGGEPPAPPRLTAASAWRWAAPAELAGLAMPGPHRKLAGRLFAR